MASEAVVAAAPAESFGFTKDTDAIARRPSFFNTLNDTLSLVEKKPGSQGQLQKRSSTGQWNKRWFVIHGHYLSYYRKDPNQCAPDQRQPLGALDLWHVTGASLDDCTITLQLSEQASEARRDEMGGDLAKKVVSTASQFSLLSKSTVKRIDALRRQHIKPKFVVKCGNALEAQQWLSLMRESPLLGSLGALFGGKVPAPVLPEGEARVKELCFSFGSREVVFGDVAAMFGDGVTELLLSNLTRELGECTVSLDNGTKSGKVALPVPLTETAGSLEIPVGTKHVVQISWTRKPIDWVMGIALPSLAVFVSVFVTVLLVSKFRLGLALVFACAAAAALAVHKFQLAKSKNDIVVKNVECREAGEPKQVVLARRTSIANGPIKLGVSKDKNISPEEAGQLEQLRTRLQNMWQPNPKADEIAKKFEKFFKEFHADVSTLKNLDRIKVVMDKHINVDFRLVRFLRARKHNVAKAEEMARDSLTWRVVLGSDEFDADDELKHIPTWLLEYFASPLLLQAMPSPAKRLSTIYQRDKEGHCAMFFRAGRINTRKIFRKCDNKICFMTKYLVAAVEIMRRDLERWQEESGVETVVSLVVDLEGFAVSEQMPIGDLVALARRFFPIFATGFPELLHRVLVFNAPWLFGTLWSAIKPFIPEEVQEKIQIHSGAVQYDKHIGKYYEPKMIPKYFGGSKVDDVDGNEYCTNMFAVYAPYVLPKEGHGLLEGVDPTAQAW